MPIRHENLIVGMGDKGKALYDELRADNPDTFGYDLKYKDGDEVPLKVRWLYICFPYSDKFVGTVKQCQKIYDPEVTSIHVEVPDEVMDKIPGQVRYILQNPIKKEEARKNA